MFVQLIKWNAKPNVKVDSRKSFSLNNSRQFGPFVSFILQLNVSLLNTFLSTQNVSTSILIFFHARIASTPYFYFHNHPNGKLTIDRGLK